MGYDTSHDTIVQGYDGDGCLCARGWSRSEKFGKIAGAPPMRSNRGTATRARRAHFLPPPNPAANPITATMSRLARIVLSMLADYETLHEWAGRCFRIVPTKIERL